MGVLRRPVLVKDLTWCLLLVFVALAGRLVQIHLRQREQLIAHTERQRRAVIKIPARRGMIVDAQGRVMAVSVERPSVYADPNRIPSSSCLPKGVELTSEQRLAEPNVVAAYRRTGAALAEVLDMDGRILAGDLMRRAGRRFMWVKRRVTDEQALAVKKLGLRGVGILYEPERQYPMNPRFAHGLGFVRIDGHGASGLEYVFDEVLMGEAGHRAVVTDVRRRAIYSDPEDYQPPRDGHHLLLTIDTVIQSIAEQELAAAVEQFHGEAGSVVVMAPKTGEVLALGNVPTFDLDRYMDFPDSARCNRAIVSPVEPGSTFKPFIAAAALAEKVTWPGEEIFCHHGLYRAGRRRLHDHHPYGNLTFEKVLIKSSNIGMAILGERLGNARLYDYICRFGFGRETGIELPGEDRGLVVPLDKWTSYSTTSLPMGQEIAVTSIQLATAFSAVVNGGVLLRPRTVRAVVDSQGRVVRDTSEPVVVRRVMAEAVARRMGQDILVRVVKEGTGRRAALSGYQVLGKTGTAQMAKKDGRGYERDAYVSSFVGAAPAEAPAVLVYLNVVRPDRRIGYYGGTVAAPAVREILAKTLAYLGVPPREPEPSSVQVASR